MTQPESLKLIFCVGLWELNGSKNNFTAKVTLHYGKRSLFWSLIIFRYLSFTTVRGQKIRFNKCECIKFLNIANIHALHILGKRIFVCNKNFFSFVFFCLFLLQRNFFPLQLRHQTSAHQIPIFAEFCLQQGTVFALVWGAACKNIIPERFSAKTATSAHI